MSDNQPTSNDDAPPPPPPVDPWVPDPALLELIERQDRPDLTKEYRDR